MRQVNLESFRHYSTEEILHSFSNGSDVKYAFVNDLFKVKFYDYFGKSDMTIRFIDGATERVLTKEVEARPGDIVVIQPHRRCKYISIPRFMRSAFHYPYRISELRTIEAAYCELLSSSEKKKVRDLMDKAAQRDGYASLHAYVVADRRKKREAERAREQTKREQERKLARFEASRKGQCTRLFKDILESHYRISDNTDDISVTLDAKENAVNVSDYTEWIQYTKHESHTKTYFAYDLTIKRGYHFAAFGGILTLWYGKLNRKGMKCQWIEQGNGTRFNKFKTVDGYFVRGEHIQASSLQEAQRINAEHRKAMFFSLVKARQQKQEKMEAYRQYQNDVITFEDSLHAGNCRPGTQNFKDNVEKALGREVNTLTVAEIIPLAIRFKQQYYVQRIFNMKGLPVKVADFE